MKKPAILGSLLAAAVLQVSPPAFADKEAVGNIIGGIIGGVIGNQIGGGNGRTAATIIGAIAGTMIGGQVGQNLEEGDRRALVEAQNRGLREQPGASIDWDGRNYGSRSGARGRFTSTREGYNQRTGEVCREYSNVIYHRNRTETTSGVACSRSDGSWYETRREEVSYDRRYDRHDDRRDDRWDRPHRPGRPGAPSRPGRPDPYNPGRPDRPTPPRPPAPYPGDYNQGTAQINQISRRAGGVWYRLTLQYPMRVSNIEARVLRAGVRFHEAALVTERHERIALYELSNTHVLSAGTITGAYINRNDRVLAIDIRAESFGAFADVLVSVTSPDGRPQLQVSQF